MAIRRFWRKSSAAGWKFDRKGHEGKHWWSWGFDIYPEGRKGKHLREPGFRTESDAEAAAARILLARKERKYGFAPQMPSPTLASLFARHVVKIAKKPERTRSTRVLNDFISLLPAGYAITETSTSDVELYVDWRFADGVGPSTVDRELNIISAALHAVDIHYPDKQYQQLHQWRPPRIPRPEYSKKPRHRLVSQDERERLLAYLFAPRRPGEQLQSATARHRVGRKVMFAFLMGCRTSEALGIQKHHIDWKQRTGKIVGTKTDRDRPTGPIPETAFKILEEEASRSTTKYVFGSPNPTSDFYKILREACAACDIPYFGRGKDPEGIRLHDARHTVTTALLQAGVDPATVQERMGWSAREFLLWYSHSTAESNARASDLLEQTFGQRRPEVDNAQAIEEVNTVQ